jgi:type IV secretory pathway VirB10-like protein
MMDQGLVDPPEDAADDSKISPDDPSVGLPSSPRSRLRPVPVALALGAVGLVVAVVILKPRPSTTSSMTQEPTVVVRPNNNIPSFLEAPPTKPVAHETPRAAPPPLLAEVTPAHHSLAPPSAADTAAQRRLDRLAQLDEEARNAPGFFKTSGPTPPAARASGDSANSSDPSLTGLPPSARAGALGANTPTDADPNLQDHKNAFLASRHAAEDYLPNTLQRPLSRFELKRTAVIPATLITAINSDLPGPITAQVRERVYDTVTGEHLLIPQGARLFGWYDSKVVWGQERVLMCWEAILFPNGNSINLDCMPAADLQGHAGLTDDVDNHWDRLVAAVGFSTVLSLGAQAAAGDPSGYQPNLAQRAAANAAGQLNNAGQAIVQRQINLQPTITVRPGFPVNLIVTKDIVLEPYVEAP